LKKTLSPTEGTRSKKVSNSDGTGFGSGSKRIGSLSTGPSSGGGGGPNKPAKQMSVGLRLVMILGISAFRYVCV